MALNPYTLNHLYEKGILDYVPTDLGITVPVNYSTANPYMNMATQGALYQNAINGTDTFTLGSNVNYNGGYTSQIGSMSNAGGLNSFIGNGIGTNNNSSILNSFGFNPNIGTNSNAGVSNSFIGNGIGQNYNGGGLKIFGGFGDTQNGIQSGLYKTAAIINNTPKLILGLIAGGIGALGIMAAFKRGKKPPKVSNSSFLSKLNILNRFKKK